MKHNQKGIKALPQELHYLTKQTPLWIKNLRRTPLYMAPEVMMGGEITEKVDVYSFGVLLWEILCCKEAYGNHTNYET